MDKICDSAKFYSNIGLNYIVAKIKITKYNHLHQSYFVDISYCDINIINLLRSISHDILRNGSGGRGSRGSKPTLPTPNKYFLMNSGRKKGRNRRQMFTFFTLLILVKLFKSIGFGIIYFGLWEGGGASAGGG